jgi:hypothetical protein
LKIPVLLAALTLAPITFAQLSKQENTVLNDALILAGVSEADLGFPKAAHLDPYRLPLNALGLRKPLDASNQVFDLHQTASGTLSSVLQAGIQAAFGEPNPPTSPLTNTVTLPPSVPEQLRQPVAYLVGCISQANGSIRKAISGLTPPQRREVIESLPELANETPLVKLGFVSKAPSGREHIFRLLSRVDLRTIREAAVTLSQQIESILPQWRSLATSYQLKRLLRFKANGIKVEIDGQEDGQLASLDTGLCINLGGRKVIKGRYGAGVGYASVLLDFGKSTYQVPDLSIGAGVLGIGLAYHIGNTCDFRGHSICFGAGLAGVGAMFIDGSDNRFRTVSLSQGFGEFGVGILLCSGGSNIFRSDLYSQGAARTQGLGWLIGQRGNNYFRAGGLAPAPDGHLSCSQGFAKGYDEPFTCGGLGLLTCLGSDSTYIGERSCQGAAELGAIGSFFDAGGHGVRSATSHAQGFADQESCAFLYDLGGNDSFSVRQATGQCFASRYSTAVGFLQEGHDQFISAGSPATASQGSVSLLFSEGAASQFVHAPARTIQNRLDSIALFCSTSDNRFAIGSDSDLSAGQTAVALQEISTPSTNPFLNPERQTTTTQPQQVQDPKTLVAQALGNDIYASREALAQLLDTHDDLEPKAAESLIESSDWLTKQLSIRLLAKYPNEATSIANALVGTGRSPDARIGVRLLGEMGTTQSLDTIVSQFDTLPSDAKIQALEELNGRVPSSFVPKLSDLANSPDPLIRRLAQNVYINR